MKSSLLMLTLVAAVLAGCKSSTPIIGSWNLAQPSPAVVNQSKPEFCSTRLVFTADSMTTYTGDATGGPSAVHFRVDKNTTWVDGQVNSVAYAFADNDHISNYGVYGLCFYVRS